MACSSCGRKYSPANAGTRTYDVMGGYKNLPDKQLKARLEVFKKRHCKDCNDRYNCDYTSYKNCTKKPQ